MGVVIQYICHMRSGHFLYSRTEMCLRDLLSHSRFNKLQQVRVSSNELYDRFPVTSCTIVTTNEYSLCR